MRPPFLAVIVARDAAMRSALSAQAATAGAEVLTARAPRAARKMLRHPAILVIDAAEMVGTAGEWVEALGHGGHWQVIVLGDAQPEAVPPDWLTHVPVHAAPGALAGILAG